MDKHSTARYPLYGRSRVERNTNGFRGGQRSEKARQKNVSGDGGAAQIIIGNVTRLLVHDINERSLHTLPCAFEIVTAASFRYKVYEDRTVVEERNFPRRQVNEAMSLLDGVAPDDEIIINPD